LVEKRADVENQYSRVVAWNGNEKAIAAIETTMERRPHFEWRGLGSIPWSALKLRSAFSAYDAEEQFQVPGVRVADPRACQCGQVLRGQIHPWECRVFATACTPEAPIGTCMVSSEGACAAFYNFGRLDLLSTRRAVRR
jgi:hydrogenase expression/formation protein HypD